MIGMAFTRSARCRRPIPPPGPVRVDLYLKPSAKEDFFKIYDDVDLRQVALEPGQAFEAAAPLCDKVLKGAETYPSPHR
ncbi:hypothetical protein [Rhodoblastus sp.]|uniref:hypothetical protein n=1 Tax=Rhodoblastus sp. TaxID=1962975 RepID=UPI003F94C84F